MKQGIDLKKACAKKLKAIAPNISTLDKQEAADFLRVHYNTINNYLRGEVADLDIGLALIEFLNGRIADHIGRLKKVLAT